MKGITIVLPSLNPDEKFTALMESLVAEFDDIVVVNDGSDSTHLIPFEKASKYPNCLVLTHEVNKGKGRALKTAFEFVADNRPNSKGVVTIDGDGQHLVKDIKACAEMLIAKENSVILGVRDFNEPEVPLRSKFGNKFTVSTFRLLCGMKISDTQTGLRGIPKDYLTEMCEVEGERFEYETNMLLFINKEKIPYKEVKISTVYLEENQSSHFNPIKDSLKIYGAIIRFSLSSIASSLVDIGVFSLLNLLLVPFTTQSTRILISTVIARFISASFNYSVNKKAVFKSDSPPKRAIVRYGALCLLQMLVSYGFVYIFSIIFASNPFAESLIKIIVDTSLFFFSYQVQKRWVFD